MTNVVTVNGKKPEGLEGKTAADLPVGTLVEIEPHGRRSITIRTWDGNLVALDTGNAWDSDYPFGPTDRILSPGETVTLTVKG